MGAAVEAFTWSVAERWAQQSPAKDAPMSQIPDWSSSDSAGGNDGGDASDDAVLAAAESELRA